MRVVAGAYRGRPIKAPKGRDTRPTSDRVREAVFSSLVNRYDCVEDASVLDLYAGSGALAIEAFSRGAKNATLVDRGREACMCVRDNCDSLGVLDRTTIVGVDAARAVTSPLVGEPFSLLFVDPPYRIEPAEVRELLEVLASRSKLSDGAVVVYEHRTGTRPEWPDGFNQTDQRTYGDTTVSYAMFTTEEESAE